MELCNSEPASPAFASFPDFVASPTLELSPETEPLLVDWFIFAVGFREFPKPDVIVETIRAFAAELVSDVLASSRAGATSPLPIAES
jgi:hypothetical protein